MKAKFANKKPVAGLLDGSTGRGYYWAVMVRIFALLLLVLAFVGCQSSNPSAELLSPEKFMAATSGLPVSESETNSMESGTNVTMRIIRPGMVISITVDEDRSLNKTIVVPGSGAIDYPPLSRVVVEGLTPEEVAQTIKQALEQDFIRSANVTCSIEAVAGGGIIYVLGSVGRPGPLLIPKEQRFTVMKAIIAAGGFGGFANTKKVELIRYDETGKKYKTFINVGKIMDGEFEKDVPVQDGDWIIIREKLINF